MGQTYAVQVVSQTKYSDHFFCVWQLWTSIGWNYGGSTKGCIEDGFSFKLGKLHVILAIAGVIYALWYSYKKKTDMRREILSVIGITFGSLFLTLYASEFIWHIFEKILKVFQFPWRFLVFGLFGVAYIISFGADQFKRKSYFVWGIIGVSILLFALNAKFFERKGIAYYDYDNQYLSEYYLVNHVAYQIPEYLPRSVNSRVWHSFSSVSKTPVFLKDIVEARDKKTSKTLKNQPYEREVETSSRNMYVNIHSAPYWHVYVNESEYLTDAFDSFGRPHVLLPQSAYPHEKNIVRVIYKQTDLEIISNVISVATLLVLIVLSTRYGRKSSKKE
jgi:multisubunit Na+/H+ antiporter MnhB subunit